MLKSILPIALIATVLLAAPAATVLATDAADVTGDWARPNGASKIQISSCGDALCGKLIWLKNPRNDTKNQDVSKRSRPLLGVDIVQSMVPTDKENQWKGEVYNAQDGKTYKGFMELTSPNTLKIEGCGARGLICKGETWTRTQ